MASTNQLPLLTRIKAVDFALRDKTQFHADNKQVEYVKGNKRESFPQYVWTVTNAITEAGQDPCFIGKAKIVEWANKVILGGKVAEAVLNPPAPKAARVATTSNDEDAAVGDQELLPEGPAISFSPAFAIYTLIAAAYELTPLYKGAKKKELQGKIREAAEFCQTFITNAPGKVEIPDHRAEPEAAVEQTAPAAAKNTPPAPAA
jgi:hypothetical protein